MHGSVLVQLLPHESPFRLEALDVAVTTMRFFTLVFFIPFVFLPLATADVQSSTAAYPKCGVSSQTPLLRFLVADKYSLTALWQGLPSQTALQQIKHVSVPTSSFRTPLQPAWPRIVP